MKYCSRIFCYKGLERAEGFVPSLIIHYWSKRAKTNSIHVSCYKVYEIKIDLKKKNMHKKMVKCFTAQIAKYLPLMEIMVKDCRSGCQKQTIKLRNNCHKITQNFVKDDQSKISFNNNNKKTIIHTRQREEAPAQEYPENRIQKKYRKQYFSNNDTRTRCIRGKCVNYKQQKAMKVIKDDGK